MNTPAHLAASLFVWRKEPGWLCASAITFGAVLPDLPMFWFYGYQKLVVGSSEHEIWSTLYFRDSWQLFFDIFNSIPFAIAAWCLFRWGWNNRIGQLIAASALLHLLCDLPLHNDDAHRHFLPFTNWRFASPVSYWDPKHHGFPMMVLEFGLAIILSGIVAFRGEEPPVRMVARLNFGLYSFLIVSGVLGIVYWFLSPGS